MSQIVCQVSPSPSSSQSFFPSSCDEIRYPTQPIGERVCFVSQIEGTVHYSGCVLASQKGHNASTCLLGSRTHWVQTTAYFAHAASDSVSSDEPRSC